MQARMASSSPTQIPSAGVDIAAEDQSLPAVDSGGCRENSYVCWMMGQLIGQYWWAINLKFLYLFSHVLLSNQLGSPLVAIF
jgi:hypothetical protein